MQMNLTDIPVAKRRAAIANNYMPRSPRNGERVIFPVKRDFLERPFNHALALELRVSGLIKRDAYESVRNITRPTCKPR